MASLTLTIAQAAALAADQDTDKSAASENQRVSACRGILQHTASIPKLPGEVGKVFLPWATIRLQPPLRAPVSRLWMEGDLVLVDRVQTPDSAPSIAIELSSGKCFSLPELRRDFGSDVVLGSTMKLWVVLRGSDHLELIDKSTGSVVGHMRLSERVEAMASQPRSSEWPAQYIVRENAFWIATHERGLTTIHRLTLPGLEAFASVNLPYLCRVIPWGRNTVVVGWFMSGIHLSRAAGIYDAEFKEVAQVVTVEEKDVLERKAELGRCGGEFSAIDDATLITFLDCGRVAIVDLKTRRTLGQIQIGVPPDSASGVRHSLHHGVLLSSYITIERGDPYPMVTDHLAITPLRPGAQSIPFEIGKSHVLHSAAGVGVVRTDQKTGESVALDLYRVSSKSTAIY